MRWNERQVAMLREMGIRLWVPDGQDAAMTRGAAGDTPLALADAPARAAVPVVAFEGTAPPAARPLAAPAVVPTGVAPSAGSIAALDWPALREAVAACTACPLCEARYQTVFGVGNLLAHWMVVGEAPGEADEQPGEPFMGKPGQLLDNMLRAVSLTRAEAEPARQVYIANTVKCRPPGNRNPEPAELAKCEPFLARQVELVRPKVILAMGRLAVQTLLRSTEPIGRLRGKVHEYLGVPLVVTYHPTYLLRNPADKAKAWDDLCLARETVAGGA